MNGLASTLNAACWPDGNSIGPPQDEEKGARMGTDDTSSLVARLRCVENPVSARRLTGRRGELRDNSANHPIQKDSVATGGLHEID